MSKRLQPRNKIDRRLGCNLWGEPKSPFNRREYGPGQHGSKKKKLSDYGIQLFAKQKLKGYYGNISEKQFRRFAQPPNEKRASREKHHTKQKQTVKRTRETAQQQQHRGEGNPKPKPAVLKNETRQSNNKRNHAMTQ